MHDRTRYQIELAGDSATLYVFEQLTDADIPPVVALCHEQPIDIRTLRVDMRAVGVLTAAGMTVVRAILSAWRARAGGAYDLRSSYLVATCQQRTHSFYRVAPAVPRVALAAPAS